MDIKTIYEDKDLLIIDKPAGIIVFAEGETKEKTVIDLLIEKYSKLGEVGRPPRYGVIHRLDKDTSGVLLIAKNNTSLAFFQKQFKNREVEKKYIALVVGNVKQNHGAIETLIGRSPQNRLKQKTYHLIQESAGKRKAATEYKVLKRFKGYTLLEVFPKTGRKHQIRCHLAYINHPIAGDKIYSFKNQSKPAMLQRLFLHAASLRLKLPSDIEQEFISELAEDLVRTVENLEKIG